ncbi:hypothetical protein PENANT_c002G10033 [Penicillium antarcticum]|uniref:Homeobox domain-containing protein n=1 Tax=Penicillium antarcticum TaxID=416450 RepID=A0A1V6QJX2_9EURO|nr:uncharacterized protein N7508_006733 [Penicillium antarcticum]KAJ5301870.1 hypothetical protein N7508_006733 [Penicillium antarcticum]OQD89505.1 hypothetical protein PENANT_c002G10033 [Penicillium antarcticum]
MSYIHPSWNYQGHQGIPMDQHMAYDPSMVPPPMMHPIDGYMYSHPPMEMMDYYHQPIMDYDEYTENLSRPRLTKEQVETLEAQFQAHPKPSSNVKRQLAAQTNLSLPRVANWFQNRRAKAKQQKRQEEFEKMTKAKAEAEEAARRKSETLEQLAESRKGSIAQEEDKAATPKPTSSSGHAKTDSISSRSKHHKTKSESAREATFASLQRALNAACAARDRFGRRINPRGKNEPTPEEEAVSPGSMPPPKSASPHNGLPNVNSSFSGWSDIKEEPAWESGEHDQNVGYTSAEQTSYSAPQPLAEMPGTSHAVQHNVDAYSGHLPPHTEEWSEDRDGSDPNLVYSNMQYPMSMQAPDIAVTRRESSDALTTSLEGIGICTGQSGMPESVNRVEGWKEPGKELDIAARRKRPRPAAIGTSGTRGLANSTSMSALSPSARIPSSGAGNPMRHSKSTQSLNSRYAGVRKASAAQRSPLNFTFAESGSLKKAEKMLRPSVSTTTLAPPTPLTPQDLQHFMPASPTDSNYCMSAHSTTQFFPTSQPMQVNIASPPTTPLDIYSPFPYQNVAPPMSAPAHVSSFPEYVNCGEPVPMTARSWADTASISSPEFPAGLQVPHSSTVSPMGYDATTDHTGQFGMEPVSGSPPLIYSIDADMPTSGELAEKRADFMMHEYPEHDGHYNGHLPMQKPKAYTFANNTTPSNYPS